MLLKRRYLFIKSRHPCTTWAKPRNFWNSPSLIKRGSCPHISLRSELCHERRKQGQVHSSSTWSRSSSSYSVGPVRKHVSGLEEHLTQRYAEKWKKSATCGCFACYDLFIRHLRFNLPKAFFAGAVCGHERISVSHWEWTHFPLHRPLQGATLWSFIQETHIHTQCTALVSFNAKLY